MIAVTSLTASGLGSQATNSFQTASISPQSGSQLVLWIAYAVAGGTTVSAVSGLGLTWTMAARVTVSASAKLDCWTAPAGAAPGSGAITITTAANLGTLNWDVDQVTGQDPVTPLITANTPTNTGSITSVAPATLSFSAAASSSDLFLAAFAVAGTSTLSSGETPAWTQLASQAHSSPTVTLQTQVSPNVTSTAASANGTNATGLNYGSAGIEVKALVAAAAGPPSLPDDSERGYYKKRWLTGL